MVTVELYGAWKKEDDPDRPLSLLERLKTAEVCAEQRLAEIRRLEAILNTPHLEPFAEAVVHEAKHQIYRFPPEHDAGHDAFDWHWRLATLAAKAARSDNEGDIEKALHHTVTAAALLANWHRHLIERRAETECIIEWRTADGRMPGIDAQWCQTHGFNCPNIHHAQQDRNQHLNERLAKAAPFDLVEITKEEIK